MMKSKSRERESRRVVLVLDDLGEAFRLDLGREPSPAEMMMAIVRGGLERVTPHGLPNGIGIYVNDDFLHEESLYDNDAATALAARESLTIFGPAIVVRERGSTLESLSDEDLAHIATRIEVPLAPRVRRPSKKLLGPRKHFTPEELENFRRARAWTKLNDGHVREEVAAQHVFEFAPDDAVAF